MREYTAAGDFVADHNIPYHSESLGGAMADGNFIYLITTATVTRRRHITKISTMTWQIVNQWPIKQGTTPQEGCYDSINNCFWLDDAGANTIYEYAGSGGVAPSTTGLDLRDNPNALYAQTANGSLYASWTAYDFKVVPYTTQTA